MGINLFKNKKLEEIKMECLNGYNKGALENVGGAIKATYAQNPKHGIEILLHIAKNTRCNNDDDISKAKQFKQFWEKIDKKSYIAYMKNLKKEYDKEMKKLSKSSIKKFLANCAKTSVKGNFNMPLRSFEEFYKSEYYEYLITININDQIAVFVQYFIQSCFSTIEDCLTVISKNQPTYGQSVKQCIDSTSNILKDEFRLTLKKGMEVDEVLKQLDPVCKKISLAEAVKKLNKVLSELAKFKFQPSPK